MCIKLLFPNVRYLIIPLMVFFLSACFSPWQGEKEGTLTIYLPGSSANRAASAARSIVTDEEAAELRYDFTLTSQGKTPINRSVSPGETSITIALVPGTWTVTVKGYIQKIDVQEAESKDVLRAMGTASVSVKAGKAAKADVSMVSATEVESWAELLEAANNEVSPEYKDREEYIIVKNDLTVETTAGNEDATATITRKITILTDNQPVTIKRGVNYEWEFFAVHGGQLTLGEKGYDQNTLVLDGNADGMNANAIVRRSLVTIFDSAEFIMNDGVTLQNNTISDDDTDISGGGVTMFGGKFTMNGGSIANNRGHGTGGGVALFADEDATTTFIMEGGSITGNTTGGNGGGVNLFSDPEEMYGDITFDMQGGSITGNHADERGGGVFVGLGSTFTRTNAKTTIENNTSSSSSNVTDNVCDENDQTQQNTATVSNWAELLEAVEDSQYDRIIVGSNFPMLSAHETAVITREITILAGTDSAAIMRDDNFVEAFFSVKSGGELILGQEGYSGELVLFGAAISGASVSATESLVVVNNDAIFYMNNNVFITGNITNGNGGGVYVASGGTFNMSGGSVSGNEALADGGGGVYVASGGTFEMSGEASILLNKTSGNGGGVYVDGTNTSTNFIKTGGIIYGNDTEEELLKNIAENEGHAVYVARPESGSKWKNATVSNNLAYSGGMFGEGWGFNVTIELDALEDIKFVKESSLPDFYEYGDEIEILIEIEDNFTVDEWYLDGLPHDYNSETGIVVISDINPGIHHVKIIARNNDSNIPYSNDLTITIK